MSRKWKQKEDRTRIKSLHQWIRGHAVILIWDNRKRMLQAGDVKLADKRLNSNLCTECVFYIWTRVKAVQREAVKLDGNSSSRDDFHCFKNAPSSFCFVFKVSTPAHQAKELNYLISGWKGRTRVSCT